MNDLINIFWFRRDLRIDDNIGLYNAISSPYPLLPIFIFDSTILKELDKKDSRVTFIHNTVKALDIYLNKFESGLLVESGEPIEIFKKLIGSYKINAVYTNNDYEPYALKRDNEVKELLESSGVEFKSFKDQVIFEKKEILNGSGYPYKVYTAYKNEWLKRYNQIKPLTYQHLFGNFLKGNFSYSFPSLEKLGFQKSDISFPDPEIDEEIVKNYDQTRDYPFLPTTKIGMHLRFGTISIRDASNKAYQLNQTWLNELIWREFFMQLLYNYPKTLTEPFQQKMDRFEWRYDEDDFKKWCNGQTGYPLVDAGMRELRETGFMHNRVRMVTASFLCKHLLIDWKWGERHFANHLLDYELSSNIGNWQWVAGTGADAQPFIRIFNPEIQQKKFDPEFKYIRKWIPEFGTPKYPKPMVQHKEATTRAKKVFSELN